MLSRMSCKKSLQRLVLCSNKTYSVGKSLARSIMTTTTTTSSVVNSVHAQVRHRSSHPGIINSKTADDKTGSTDRNITDPRCSVLCEVPDKPGMYYHALSFSFSHLLSSIPILY